MIVEHNQSTYYKLPYPTTNTGTYDNKFKYNGKELDDATGMYYYGARYYDPRISIFVSADPLAEKMPSWSPYVYTFNNPIMFNDPDGRIPIIPWLLKAGAGAGADMLAQATMDYMFNSDTKNWSQAFDNVNWYQVGRSGAEGLIPWRTPGGRIGRAAATATVDVLVNAANNPSGYTAEQAGMDFATGFIGDLAGGGLGELVAKYGSKGVANGLLKMGFDTKFIREATGGLNNKEVRSWYNEQVKGINIKLDPTEANARMVVGQRNSLKQQARDLMSDRKAAADLGISDPIMDFDHYYKKYNGDYSRIMKGGTTPNADVNKKLGVE